MAVDKKLLKKLTILYVEDDTHIRDELSSLMTNFFAHVYTAADGLEGLELYKNNQDTIDLVISDISMPNMNGIEMLREIRNFDKEVSVIFATAYSDKEFLIDSIKLKVFNYIIKPIDVRGLLTSINELALVMHHKELLFAQNKELEIYKEAVDSNNIVMKTDPQMNITYVNKHFCDVTSFTHDELISKPFKELSHPDNDKSIYTQIYANVLDNKSWHGKLKQAKLDGSAYIVDTYMIATHDEAGHIDGTISIQKDITEEVNRQREVQVALMKDKGEIFIKSKEKSARKSIQISQLERERRDLESIIRNNQIEKDKYIYAIEMYKTDIKKFRSELIGYRKEMSVLDDKGSNILRTNKENSDLRIEVKRLHERVESILLDADKRVNQARVTLEIQIDDLEKENDEYKDQLEYIDDGQVLTQKIEYWKVKAKKEAQRVEELERKIMQLDDKNILTKLFGGTIK